MRPETKSQHLANIKAALIELHDQCGDKWMSNKEFPISELANTYLKSNSSLKAYFVKYAVNELLQTEDSGRSYKFTWKDRQHLPDTEYEAKKILSGFLEHTRVKVAPIPTERKLRKLEEPKVREFSLGEKVYVMSPRFPCEALVKGKTIVGNIAVKYQPSQIRYQLQIFNTEGNSYEISIFGEGMYASLNELFDFLRTKVVRIP